MQSLKKSLYNPSFSHIYIEKQVWEHYRTKKIIEKFPHAQLVIIDHYKDVFSRPRQNYTVQKQSMNLILAEKKGKLVYKGARVCQDFGHDKFYYTSTIMNCIYDCEYCYLQGMYTSANIVVFVNIEDMFKEVEELLRIHPTYLCISYDTDILAFENIVGYAKQWVEFSRNKQGLTLELRTKSGNFNAIEYLEPAANVILAWTLSPTKIIDEYENRTPTLTKRIQNINMAINKGWKVRLCFDPILKINQWQEIYEEFINNVFNQLPKDQICDVSLGVFRVPKDYLKIMIKNRPDSYLLNYPFNIDNNVCSYDSSLSDEMILYLYKMIKSHIEEDKIFVL